MNGAIRIPCDAPLYPVRLRERLGAGAPEALQAVGACRLLRAPLTAVLCSTRVPAGVEALARELVGALVEAAAPVVSGFQSEVERGALDALLQGSGSVVVVPARGLGAMRIPSRWAGPLATGRLLAISAAPENRRRADARLAEARNRVVAALADRVVVVYAAPAGRLYRLAREVAARGQPLFCADHPANRDLVLLGARPLAEGGAG